LASAVANRSSTVWPNAADTIVKQPVRAKIALSKRVFVLIAGFLSCKVDEFFFEFFVRQTSVRHGFISKLLGRTSRDYISGRDKLKFIGHSAPPDLRALN
jgi:hypothetical protein